MAIKTLLITQALKICLEKQKCVLIFVNRIWHQREIAVDWDSEY